MPLHMTRDVLSPCAVTGSGSSQDRSPHVSHQAPNRLPFGIAPPRPEQRILCIATYAILETGAPHGCEALPRS